MATAPPCTSCPSCGAECKLASRACGACIATAAVASEAARAGPPSAGDRNAGWAPSTASVPRPASMLAAPVRAAAPPRCPWAASAVTPARVPVLPPPIKDVPRLAGLPEPWFFLLIGLVLAPILTFTPILRYMGWFLGSLFHETGHAAVGWLLGCPTVPALRIDGHAAAIHSDPSTLLRIAVMAGLVGLLARVRARRVARAVVALALLVYPALAFTDAREVAFLIAGHLGEAAFATVLLLQALDGGFSDTREERATHSMVGWYLVGRNVSLCGGLLLHSAARSDYAQNGSFGLVNDYLRLAGSLGIGLEPIALVMLVVAVLPLPLALLLERCRASRG